MTQQHPIIPPPELVEQWINEGPSLDQPTFVAHFIATRATQWGADQELEECCEKLRFLGFTHAQGVLREIRRPKPPSLKQQALEAMREMQIKPCIIDGVNMNAALQAKYDTIRRALEQLDD